MASFLSIAAVIPVFNPDQDKLRRVILMAASQCRYVLVVDNGAALTSLSSWQHSPKELQILGDGVNLGVASAHNTGIRKAMELGLDAVLLLDQDSLPSVSMIKALGANLQKLNYEGKKVTACGPRYQENASASLSGFMQIHGRKMLVTHPNEKAGATECAFLISSGMLIPINTLKAVGLMEESLFIDHVDTEWCFRAKSLGYSCYGVREAVMQHELGIHRKKIWLGRWRQVPIHSDKRYYYLARNTLWLCRRKYIPFPCKKHLLIRLLGLFVFNAVLEKNAPKIRRSFLSGLKDGFFFPHASTT